MKSTFTQTLIMLLTLTSYGFFAHGHGHCEGATCSALPDFMAHAMEAWDTTDEHIRGVQVQRTEEVLQTKLATTGEDTEIIDHDEISKHFQAANHYFRDEKQLGEYSENLDLMQFWKVVSPNDPKKNKILFRFHINDQYYQLYCHDHHGDGDLDCHELPSKKELNWQNSRKPREFQ